MTPPSPLEKKKHKHIFFFGCLALVSRFRVYHQRGLLVLTELSSQHKLACLKKEKALLPLILSSLVVSFFKPSNPRLN